MIQKRLCLKQIRSGRADIVVWLHILQQMQKMMAPALFISHGSPNFALETKGRAAALLREFGKAHSNVSAVLVISAHWQTSKVVKVQRVPAPDTLYDFGGFSPSLNKIKYKCRGAPQPIVDLTIKLIQGSGFIAKAEQERGLDHGVWVPLLHLFPEADKPVFQISMPQQLTPRQAIALGKALAPLRREGVMVVGSGALTHNIRDAFDPKSDKSYAERFVKWAYDCLSRRDDQSISRYRQSKDGQRAHPSQEHFLPVLIAFGASSQEDELNIKDAGLDLRVLSMGMIEWKAKGVLLGQ